MSTPTPATVDILARAVRDWTRGKGLPNHTTSVQRYPGHYHVVDCRFDMTILRKIALPGVGTTIETQDAKGGECHVCAEQAAMRAAGQCLFWVDYIRNGLVWEIHDHCTTTRLIEIGTRLAEAGKRGARITEVLVMNEDGEELNTPEGFPQVS